MTPKITRKDCQNDLFKIRLETLCDPQHALIRLADTIAWQHLDEQLKEYFCGETFFSHNFPATQQALPDGANV